MATDFITGLDLGQAQDYTAVSVVQRDDSPSGRTYRLRHLERLPLGTPYTDVLRHVVGLMRRPPLPGSTLVVDMTGVGRPVVDLLRQARLPVRLVPVTITGGAHVSGDTVAGFAVAKVVLVSSCQLLLQGRRLAWPRNLPLADVLSRELANFRVKVTKAAHETYAAREGEHDDLVLSVMLAAWFGESRPRSGAPAAGTARPTLNRIAQEYSGDGAAQGPTRGPYSPFPRRERPFPHRGLPGSMFPT